MNSSTREEGVIEIVFLLPEPPDVPAITDAIVELYKALDALHRARGGTGLKVAEVKAVEYDPSYQFTPEEQWITNKYGPRKADLE